MNTSPKTSLVGFLFVLWIQFGEITSQCLSRSDACFPPVPCEHGEKVSNPSDCESYQVCLAPYEWVIDASDCEGGGWHFSNSSCTCLTSNACVDPWECPVGTSVPPRNSAPCFLEPKECTSTINGYYVPDAYYCSKYFECDQGIEDWVSMTCPPGEYFDETLLFLPQPCRADIGACERIAFDQCFPYTGPTTTTILITTTMPTTTVPTTTVPTTTVPTTTVPTTTVPTTTVPTTTVPTTTVPTTTEPTTTVPTTTVPTTTVPTTTVPTTTEPTTTVPTTTVPTTTVPTTTEATTTVPTTTEPTTTEPTTTVPTTMPTTTEPTTTVPTTTEPTTTEPTTTEPTTTEPTTTEPTTTLPTTTLRTTPDLTTTDPSTTILTTMDPSTTELTTMLPTSTDLPTTIPITLVSATAVHTTSTPTVTKLSTTGSVTMEITTTEPESPKLTSLDILTSETIRQSSTSAVLTSAGLSTLKSTQATSSTVLPERTTHGRSTPDPTTPKVSTTEHTSIATTRASTSSAVPTSTVRYTTVETTTSAQPLTTTVASTEQRSTQSVTTMRTSSATSTQYMSTTTHPFSADACEPLYACSNGEKVAHKGECNLFFECVDGSWEEKDCEVIDSGAPYYNPDRGTCQIQFWVDCDVRCHTDGIRISKMTRNIAIIATMGGIVIIAIVLIAVLCTRGTSDSYDYLSENAYSLSGVTDISRQTSRQMSRQASATVYDPNDSRYITLLDYRLSPRAEEYGDIPDMLRNHTIH